MKKYLLKQILTRKTVLLPDSLFPDSLFLNSLFIVTPSSQLGESYTLEKKKILRMSDFGNCHGLCNVEILFIGNTFFSNIKNFIILY